MFHMCVTIRGMAKEIIEVISRMMFGKGNVKSNTNEELNLHHHHLDHAYKILQVRSLA